MRAQPLVRECWMLSGEIDFVLKCVAPDLKTFQAFVAELTGAPAVRNVKTSLTLRNSKDAAMVPMEVLKEHDRQAFVSPARRSFCRHAEAWPGRSKRVLGELIEIIKAKPASRFVSGGQRPAMTKECDEADREPATRP